MSQGHTEGGMEGGWVDHVQYKICFCFYELSSSTLRLNARILMQAPPCLMQVRNSLVYEIALRVGELWNHIPAHGASKTSCPKGIIKCKNQRDFFSAIPG
jgi:hypothetical protein